MHKVTFFCSQPDQSLAIQLEPEAWTYTIGPGEEISFVAVISPKEEFSWAMTMGAGTVQLFPMDGQQVAAIFIYKNGIQIPNLAYPIS